MRELNPDTPFVASDLNARASASLQKEVEDELAKPDPSKEEATASFRKAIASDGANRPEEENPSD